jgi:NitT/TauT family transport system substrate-binding protein
MKWLIRTAVAAVALTFSLTAYAKDSIDLRFSESTSGFSFLQSNLPSIIGLFQDEGINVQYVKSAGAATGINALISGDVDVYIGSTDALLKAREKGAPIVAIAALTTQFVSGITVSRDWADKHGVDDKSPIEQKLKALKGATIGITGPGSGSDQIVRFSATVAGLDPDRDVHVVAMGNQGANFLAAMQQKRIDGFALSAPTSYQAIKDQNAMMLVNSPVGELKPLDGYLYIVAAVTEDWLKKNPETAMKLLRAFQKGLDIAHDPKKDPEVREKVRQALYSKYDKAVFEQAWADNKQAVPTSIVITPEQMKMVVDFENHFAKKPLGEDMASKAYDSTYAKKVYAELHGNSQ